jgi:hypothetical protein
MTRPVLVRLSCYVWGLEGDEITGGGGGLTCATAASTSRLAVATSASRWAVSLPTPRSMGSHFSKVTTRPSAPGTHQALPHVQDY